MPVAAAEPWGWTALTPRVVAVLVTGLAVVITFLLARPGSGLQVAAFLVPFVATAVLLGPQVRAATGRSRTLLQALWAGVALYAVAMTAWFGAPVALGHELPYPSVVDGVFLAAFVLYGVFLVAVLRASSHDERVESRLALTDSLIVTTSATAVIWVVLIGPAVASATSLVERAVTLMYPTANLLLLALVARLAVSGRMLRTPAGALLLVWITVEAAADAVYGLQIAQGTFDPTGPLTATWMLSYTAFAALAAHPALPGLLRRDDEAPTAPPAPAGRYARHALLLAATVVPLVLIARHPGDATLLVTVAIVTSCLVSLRFLLLTGDLGEQRRLADRLQTTLRQMRRMAFEDPLTGLGNRALFLRRVAELHEEATATGTRARLAVIMLDLDDFKFVNDSLGHETGDALLAAAAARLGDVVGEAGTVTRLGGDEFTVILPGADEAAAAELAERVLAAFARDFHVLGLALRTTTSIGISTSTAGTDATSLLRSADLAMYAAKAAGKGTVQVYREDLLRQAQERLRLENHLRHAARREELRLEYQPVVDARTGSVAGLEALVRWEHPSWGTVPPGRFIPVAEASGTILVIGEWVLRTACRQAVAFAQDHGVDVGMSVNVSVRQLQADGFVEVVADALATSGLAPSLLTLEVTESLFMAEDPAVGAVLGELGALGVHLSIDDFGTGHSALARLRVLPVSELKIDRSFVRTIGSDGDCGPLVTAILAMARALGLSVVAEGVETAEQLAALRDAGCDRLQGFHLARPMPAAEVAGLLTGQPAVEVARAR
ncbi:EAL domain-containing protein [Actinotalea sp. AC32]|nr:EAL domain-containing protein [Actinotalea sp. AC32]